MTNSGTDEDKELVRLVGQGDRGAMHTLYSAHIEYLTGVCSRYIVDNDELHDVLQESFVKILTSISSFTWRGPGSLRAWMSKIVVNESLSSLRRSVRFDVLDNIPEAEPVYDSPPDPLRVPPDVLERMIHELPAGYRTVFNLYVFENKSHKEIASLLGIKENSSASQFNRAKKILAKKINDYTHRL